MNDTDRRIAEAEAEKKRVLASLFRELKDPSTPPARKAKIQAAIDEHRALKQEQSMKGDFKMVNGKLERIQKSG